MESSFVLFHHFSFTYCSEVVSKRTQQDASEERVTTKSKPMMNLVSRYSVRDPNVLVSTASESQGKPDLKVKYFWARGMSSVHQTTQNGTFTTSVSSVEICRNVGRSTGRPVDDNFVIDDDMDSDTAAESNLPLKSRSYLNWVNDR